MRQLRAKVSESAFYHVTSRALERRYIFDEVAAETFRVFLRQVEAFTGVRVVTYCIMSNHFHLLLQVPARQTVTDSEMLGRLETSFSPKAYARFRDRWERMLKQGNASGLDELRQGVLQRMYDLSFFMKELKQRFSIWHNFREKRNGPVWEDRFKSTLIENKRDYLATAAVYIDLNPVRAGIVPDPKDYRFCGYAEALAGKELALSGLGVLTERFGPRADAGWILSTYRLMLFGKGESKKGKKGFAPETAAQVFSEQGELQPWTLAAHRLRWLSDGAVIGSKAFVQDFRTRMQEKLGLRRQIGAYEAAEATPLCSLRSLSRDENQAG